MDEFKTGDIVTVGKDLTPSRWVVSKRYFPKGLITKIEQSEVGGVGLLIFGLWGSRFKVKEGVGEEVFNRIRHATDREKLLYYTHGQMVLKDG